MTNVQPDHLDFYGTFEQVQAAYARFAATVQPDGLLVTCADDRGSRTLCEVARAAGTRVVTYGMAADADVRLTDVGGAGMQAHATLTRGALSPGSGVGGVGGVGRAGRVEADAGPLGFGRLDIGIPGRHNLLNATAAFVAATEGLGQDPVRVLRGLASFTGTRRRFEPKGDAGGIRVVDDYAHNPGKVTAVVETALVLAAPGRLIVVFQPHLYSRTRDFAAELAQALSPADIVLVMDVYAAREDPMPGVSGELITDQLCDRYAGDPEAGERVRFVPSWSEVAPLVVRLARPGDLVLTVGAGDVTMIGPEILRLLGSLPKADVTTVEQLGQERN